MRPTLVNKFRGSSLSNNGGFSYETFVSSNRSNISRENTALVDLSAGVWPPCCARSSFVGFRCGAHAPVVHAANHVDQTKRSMIFFFYACISVPIVMGLRLAVSKRLKNE